MYNIIHTMHIKYIVLETEGMTYFFPYHAFIKYILKKYSYRF